MITDPIISRGTPLHQELLKLDDLHSLQLGVIMQ